MLYNLIKIEGGRRSIIMTDQRTKVLRYMKVARTSRMRQNVRLVIESTEETAKYKKPKTKDSYAHRWSLDSNEPKRI